MTDAEKLAALLDEITTELDAADAHDPGRGGQHVGTGPRLANAPKSVRVWLRQVVERYKPETLVSRHVGMNPDVIRYRILAARVHKLTTDAVAKHAGLCESERQRYATESAEAIAEGYAAGYRQGREDGALAAEDVRAKELTAEYARGRTEERAAIVTGVQGEVQRLEGAPDARHATGQRDGRLRRSGKIAALKALGDRLKAGEWSAKP